MIVKLRHILIPLTVLSLLLSLSHWQWRRYQEKKVLEHTLAEHHIEHIQAVWPKAPIEGMRLSGKARMETSKAVLLANQWHQHHLGVQVLVPLCLSNHCVWLEVGWSRQPEQLLKSLPTGLVHWQAQVHYPKPVLLLQADAWQQGRVAGYPVVETFDLPRLSLLHPTVEGSYTLRLDKNMPFGGVREWVWTSLPSSRHLGYSIQWLLLSAVFLLAYVFFW